MKAKKLIALLCAALILLPSCASGSGETTEAGGTDTEKNTETTADSAASQTVTTEEETVNEEISSGGVLNYADMKAMWLSQYDLNSLYCSGGTQNAEKTYTKLLKKLLKNVSDNGFNTVIVQVRPNADSMYPSEVYPMSYYVVGKYGNEAKYDPFAILIEEAHSLGLSVQAWINPLRCMTAEQIKSVDDRYKIKQWYDSAETNGRQIVLKGSNYYLNPAYPEVRELIISGAVEILEKYAVDGLHMDDYFYPTTDASFDSAAYTEYKNGGGKLALADFRRSVLSELVAGLYYAVKNKDAGLQFGISPAGNINTVYNSQYADVYLWCKTDGYLDYICPQVYFGMEHQTYDFRTVCNTWQNIIKKDNIKLIIGMSLGKAKSKVDNYAGSGKNEWAEHTDILKRCLEYTLTLKKCAGVSYFCYQYFYNPTSGAEVSETKAERNNFLPVLATAEWKYGK